jgi:hypothetical protein
MESLDQILRQSWNLLFRGAVQTRHAYHTPVLASTNGTIAKSRTVVLRKTIVNERQLWVYTDVRSDKVNDFRQQPQGSFTFWDKGKSIQLRVQASVQIHHEDEPSREVWRTIAAKNRKDYATSLPSGTAISESGNIFPDRLALDDLTIENTNPYFNNFALLVFTVHHIDYLKLSRDGHTRAVFIWDKNQWEQTFLVP